MATIHQILTKYRLRASPLRAEGFSRGPNIAFRMARSCGPTLPRQNGQYRKMRTREASVDSRRSRHETYHCTEGYRAEAEYRPRPEYLTGLVRGTDGID
jgi:hypothetical protein